ncbi:MAG: PEGA domain-containing protein [Deltaproteobacteria bacterium]|nr:PEGA domain-containing protein [Deltaproteobacteria bacterium]
MIVIVSAAVRADAPPKLLRDAKRLFGLSDYKGALRILERLVAKEPPPDVRVQAEVYRGLCHVRLDNKGAAREAFRRVVTLDPEAGPDKRRVGPEAFAVFEEARASVVGGLRVMLGPRVDVYVCVDGRRRRVIGWFNDDRIPVGRRKVEACDRDGRPIGIVQEVVVRANATAVVRLAVPLPPSAKVRVASTPAGASIEVGGRATGLVTKFGEAVEVEIPPDQQVDVVLRLAGYADARIPVVIGAGKKVDVSRTLEKLAAATPTVVVDPTVRPRGDKKSEAGVAVVKPTAEVRVTRLRAKSPLTTWAFVVGGVSVASLAAGVVFAVLGKSLEDDLNAYARCANRGGTAAECGGWTKSEYEARYARASGRLTAATVFFALSGAAAGGAGLLFYLGRKGGVERRAAVPAVRISANGVQAEFAF